MFMEIRQAKHELHLVKASFPAPPTDSKTRKDAYQTVSDSERAALYAIGGITLMDQAANGNITLPFTCTSCCYHSRLDGQHRMRFPGNIVSSRRKSRNKRTTKRKSKLRSLCCRQRQSLPQRAQPLDHQKPHHHPQDQPLLRPSSQGPLRQAS